MTRASCGQLLRCARLHEANENDAPATKGRAVESLRKVSRFVRSHHEETERRLQREITDSLLAVDPLVQQWNVFRMFGVQYREVRWTQWFASILRYETGERCARLVWGAFCDAVARRAEAIRPIEAVDHEVWRRIADEVPVVEDEVSHREYGQLDLLITTPSVVAAVENKLFAHWHNWSTGEPDMDDQSARYRNIARERLAGDSKRQIGLVLLSANLDLQQQDYPPDYVYVTWRDVGQALRRALHNVGPADSSGVIELWPAVLTLMSIEQDLLGLSREPSAAMGRGARVAHLTTLATYLAGR